MIVSPSTNIPINHVVLVKPIRNCNNDPSRIPVSQGGVVSSVFKVVWSKSYPISYPEPVLAIGFIEDLTAFEIGSKAGLGSFWHTSEMPLVPLSGLALEKEGIVHVYLVLPMPSLPNPSTCPERWPPYLVADMG